MEYENILTMDIKIITMELFRQDLMSFSVPYMVKITIHNIKCKRRWDEKWCLRRDHCTVRYTVYVKGTMPCKSFHNISKINYTIYHYFRVLNDTVWPTVRILNKNSFNFIQLVSIW